MTVRNWSIVFQELAKMTISQAEEKSGYKFSSDFKKRLRIEGRENITIRELLEEMREKAARDSQKKRKPKK